MNIAKHTCLVVAAAGLFYTGVTGYALHRNLPPEIRLNEGAGRGDWIMVTLHMQDGAELPFLVDTGAPFTYFDKSLEPKLGNPIGNHVAISYYGKFTGHVCRAPKLFLGGTQLRTDREVITLDLKRLSDCRTHSQSQVMGILGMDCLRHYCIQLDFAAAKMQFLDPDHLDTRELGRAFAFSLTSRRPMIHENLLGMPETTLIDLGCPNDGQLSMKLLAETANRRETVANAETPCPFKNKIRARFSSGVFGGENYPSLHITGNNDDNTIGLRFLARHLVTLNFPKRTMYLKRVSAGPLAP